MADTSDECVVEVVYAGEPIEIIYKGDKICVVGSKENRDDDDGIKDPIGIAASRDLAGALASISGDTASIAIDGPIDLDEVMAALRSSDVSRLFVTQARKHD